MLKTLTNETTQYKVHVHGNNMKTQRKFMNGIVLTGGKELILSSFDSEIKISQLAGVLLHSNC